MTKAVRWYIGVVVLGFLALGIIDRWPAGGTDVPRPDTVYIGQVRVVAETTLKTVTRVRDSLRIDTLKLTDTVRVPVQQLVTVFERCEECARKLDEAADVIAAKNDTIYQLRRALAKCEASRKKDRTTYGAGGLLLGVALACR